MQKLSPVPEMKHLSFHNKSVPKLNLDTLKALRKSKREDRKCHLYVVTNDQ